MVGKRTSKPPPGGSMATDSTTAPALDAPADREGHGTGWREGARSGVYWGVAHGLPRLVIREAARRGDLQGRLMLAPASGDQVWQLLAEARDHGPLLRSRLSYLTADYAAVKEILSSPDFQARPSGRVARPGPTASWGACSTGRRLQCRTRSSRRRCWRPSPPTTPATAGWSPGASRSARASGCGYGRRRSPPSCSTAWPPRRRPT